jgi:parallel beta-helix repeat protein
MSTPKQLLVSKRKLFLAIISIALICSLASGSIMYVVAQGGSTPITISSGIYPGAPTYTIYANGLNYIAKDAYGVISYSSVDWSSFIDNLSGTILFKKGNYVLPKTTIVSFDIANTVIMGEGWDTIFTVPSDTTATNYLVATADGIQFKNFAFDGNDVVWNGIGDKDNTAITFNIGADNGLVENIYIYDHNGTVGVFVYSSYTKVINNRFEHLWGTPIQANGWYATISSNDINDAGYYGGGIELEGSQGSIVTDNIMTNLDGSGLRINNAHNNTMANNFVNVTLNYGLWLTAGSSRNSAVNNKFCYAGLDSIIIDQNSNYNKIQNNELIGSGHSGIYLINTHNNTIQGNIIDAIGLTAGGYGGVYGGHAVYDCVIQNNIFTVTYGTSNAIRFVETDCDRNVITGNTLPLYLYNGYHVSVTFATGSGTKNIITNNQGHNGYFSNIPLFATNTFRIVDGQGDVYTLNSGQNYTNIGSPKTWTYNTAVVDGSDQIFIYLSDGTSYSFYVYWNRVITDLAPGTIFSFTGTGVFSNQMVLK